MLGLAFFFSATVFAQSAPKVMRLDASLNATTEAALSAEGVKILHYYGDQTYLFSKVPDGVKSSPVRLNPEKGTRTLDFDIANEEQLEVDLVLAYPEASAHLEAVLAKAGFLSAEDQVLGGTTLTGTVPAAQIATLLDHPLILNATPVMNEFIPYHLEGRIAQGITPLNSGIAGAPDLNGEGVVLGIGDGGMLSGHPDIGDRVISTTNYYNPGWGAHPDMVAGIMASTGSVFSENRGVACEAELVIEPSSGIVYWAPSYLAQFQMSITNNSYGPRYNCNTANKYYGTCASVDQQLFDNPNLLHVYAVGNSGGSSCYGLPKSYSTIPGGGQVAKNTLSVGNAKFDRTRNAGSSAGPTFDGRIKPEIMAIGSAVVSNNRSGGYNTGSGTSYASPAVAATLGLLTQRYKELHNGILPDAALLKAIACNTADDIGPSGPDFQHGFGLINGVKALSALESSTYHQGYLGQGAQYVHTVTTTGSTERVKFLLYWPDQAGPTTNTTATLVNDFDLMVVTPSGDTVLPLILDPLNPASVAVQGKDTLNNIEQITIDAPAAGTYTLLVDGQVLPYGTTDFVLSWVIQEPEVLLTCPYGGESLNPNDTVYIAWDASPGQTGTWKVEYNVDGGSWQTISAGIPSSARHIIWVPSLTNAAVEIRVTNEVTMLSDQTNEPAYVIGKPENVVGTSRCDGGVLLNWSPVEGASAYRVFKFDGAEMSAVATVTDTFTAIEGLQVGIDSLFTVAAISPSGKTSQRAYAVNRKSEISGPNCYAPLPVEWLSVKADPLGDDVEILWTVAAELNNEHFEVLRSATGTEWEVIGKVEGRGTAPSLKTYAFVDEASAQVGITYYQIKQIDFDGRSELSEIVAHTFSASSVTSQPATVSIVGNPVQEVITLKTENSNAIELTLFDLAGRALKNFHLQPGERTIDWPSDLGVGMYVLQANMSSGTANLRLMKW